MIIKEVDLTEAIAEQLISLSADWEKEDSCHGYQKNNLNSFRGNQIFLAIENNIIIGYLFGHKKVAKEAASIYQADTKYFEVEELYIKPEFRSRGIGKQLFQYVEREVSAEVDMLIVNTATKNSRAILHFYIDEVGMEFWYARLFKKI